MNIITELPEALQPLAKYPQFILWKMSDGKKLPISHLTLKKTNAHNSDVWLDAASAINVAKLYGNEYGIGFVFTDNDPFVFFDLDKCLLPDNKTWSPVALEILGMLPGAAVEVSQSRRGLHIFGMYSGAIPEHACKNISQGLECYHTGRFVALTGINASGTVSTDLTAMLPAVINKHFLPNGNAANSVGEWTTQPVQEWNGPTNDEVLIEKAENAKQSAAGAFGDSASFCDLNRRNVEALSAAYAPDESDKGEYDESSADMAFALQLAFWAGKDCARIERLMWKSKLHREKWTKHKTYLRNTIKNAVALCSNVYGQSVQATNSTESVDSVEFRTGFQFLAATQQVEHFAECVYVRDLNRVYTPDGSLLNREQFNATYGGYIFELDSGGSGKTTRKAWEAFTESQAINYPWAHSVCFRPELLK